jgi:hypothetical protein
MMAMAGMPNFRGDRRSLITRVARQPSSEAEYRALIEDVVIEAVAIPFDQDAWIRVFERLWPEGSAAWLSYAGRMVDGPDFDLQQALGPGVDRVRDGR